MFGRTLSLSAPTRSTSPEPTLTNRRRRHFIAASSLADLWRAEIDSRLSYFQMNAYYFMAGYMNTISYSAVFVWCGFQSGNTTQLAIAMARFWEQEARQFLLADRQALASLLSFVGGALIARLGERIGPTSRGWLWLGTMCQALFTMAAAISSWKSGQGYPGISDDRYVKGPAWSDTVSFLCLMFMSCSMGMQGLMSLRLQTPSAATLPLTTTWCELMGVGALFNLNRLDYARDQKVLGIFSVMFGAAAGRGLIFKLGSPGALGIAVGIRVLIAFSWIFVPGSEPPIIVMDQEKATIDGPSPESNRSSIVIIPRSSTDV